MTRPAPAPRPNPRLDDYPMQASKNPVLVQPEKDFQGQVIMLAKLYGWLAYHTHDSRKSAAGWPDLGLCRPPRLILAECKTDTGTVGYYQRQWLTALEACPGVETYIWRPAMWPEITAILA